MLKKEEIIKTFQTKPQMNEIITDMKDSVNTIWILTSAINIIAMQLGFTLLEVGSIHPKNKSNILIKNLLDTFIGALAYYSMGYAVANQAQGGMFGNGSLFCMGLDSGGLLGWIFQFSFCTTSATIVSGSLAERTFIDTYIVFSFLMGGVIYPVAASWVWGGGWLSEMGFKDFAGSGVVHELGGFGGFVGTMILGPRINFFDDEKLKEETKKRRREQIILEERLDNTPVGKRIAESIQKLNKKKM